MECWTEYMNINGGKKQIMTSMKYIFHKITLRTIKWVEHV
jgi:hypothetical protein